MPKENKSLPLGIRVPASTLKALTELAVKDSRTVNKYIVKLLNEHVEKPKAKA